MARSTLVFHWGNTARTSSILGNAFIRKLLVSQAADAKNFFYHYRESAVFVFYTDKMHSASCPYTVCFKVHIVGWEPDCCNSIKDITIWLLAVIRVKETNLLVCLQRFALHVPLQEINRYKKHRVIILVKLYNWHYFGSASYPWSLDILLHTSKDTYRPYIIRLPSCHSYTSLGRQRWISLWYNSA